MLTNLDNMEINNVIKTLSNFNLCCNLILFYATLFSIIINFNIPKTSWWKIRCAKMTRVCSMVKPAYVKTMEINKYINKTHKKLYNPLSDFVGRVYVTL